MPRLVPDARFARAYDALGDQGRARLKSIIADHYVLNRPSEAPSLRLAQRFTSGLEREAVVEPRPFVLLLADASLDAPALFLAALVPALCSGSAEVLVLRLGPRAAVPDVLLTACELAGQERVAAIAPAQAVRLLAECAAGGRPGLVLHPDTAELRRVLARPELRAQLASSPLRLVPLRLPQTLGLWRDEPGQFAPELLGLLYGEAAFEAGGAGLARRSGKGRGGSTDGPGFAAFAAAERDVLLVPDGRLHLAQSRARLTLSESRLGLWVWPELEPGLFRASRLALGSACATHNQG